MSKTALLEAVRTGDLDGVKRVLAKTPDLAQFKDEKGLNLLQLCCKRFTGDDPAAADRQLRLAKWLVGQGFDPLVVHTTAPGEDGEEDAARISLAFFAVAR